MPESAEESHADLVYANVALDRFDEAERLLADEATAWPWLWRGWRRFTRTRGGMTARWCLANGHLEWNALANAYGLGPRMATATLRFKCGRTGWMPYDIKGELGTHALGVLQGTGRFTTKTVDSAPDVAEDVGNRPFGVRTHAFGVLHGVGHFPHPVERFHMDRTRNQPRRGRISLTAWAICSPTRRPIGA